MTTETPDTGQPKAAQLSKEKPARRRVPLGALAAAVLLYLLEALVPVAAAAVILWLLFTNYNLWQYNRIAMLSFFGAAVVIIAIILSVLVDSLTTPMRKANKQVKFGSGPRARLVKLILGGLVVPIALIVASNLVPVQGQATTMSYLIEMSKPPVKVAAPEQVAKIAMQSENTATSALSIQVLQGMKNQEGLDQLLVILNSDPSALADSSLSAELSNAIASYGATAKDPLYRVFKGIDPTQAAGGSAVPSDLYDRYFASSFESLRAEITTSVPDQQARDARLAQVQAAQAQLKASLGQVQAGGITHADASKLDFILRTYLAMDIKDDKALVQFGKDTAADGRYAPIVRGDALLLVGKFGGKDDIDALMTYLQNSDALIQARALQAITMIQAKVNGAPQGQ